MVLIFAALFEFLMSHIFHRKKLDDFGAENLTKITINVDIFTLSPKIYLEYLDEHKTRDKAKISIRNIWM